MPRWLLKRGSIWHYRFTVGGVAYFGTTEATDLATAKVVLEQVRRDSVLGEAGVRKAPTLLALAEVWMETRGKAVSPSHLRAARQSLEALEPLHRLPLTHITTTRVDDWRARYMEAHSPASANLILRYLKLWCRWAMAEKLIKEMPYTVRPLRVQERQRPVVTVPQLEGFMDAIRRGHRNPQVPAAVTMALMLGLRESEVLGATWGALQGRNFVVRGVTKSKRIRTIPVPDEVWTSLGWMLVDLHPGITGPHPLPKLGLIFPGTRGTKHQQGWLRQALERGCPGLGMHRLRASFITAHLKAGTTLKDVQQMAGHADARTTIGYQETSLEEQAIRQQTLWKKA